jgi:acyl-CoA hydrolase
MPSTAENGTISRIVPFLKEGAGVTLHRGDVHYVVTEYGIAYLQGKNIRERAMELISITHPKFRPRLIEEAKKQNLIFKDQAFISGESPWKNVSLTHSTRCCVMCPVMVTYFWTS